MNEQIFDTGILLSFKVILWIIPIEKRYYRKYKEVRESHTSLCFDF